MVHLILPLLGCTLFIIALSRIAMSRTLVTVLNMGAATCGLVAFVLWPDPYAMAFDHWIGASGLGFYLTRLTVTCAATLHIIAVASGIGRWDRLRQGLLVPPVLLFTGFFTLFWALARSNHMAHPEALFYQGYLGRPEAIFGMSMARGVTILWYSAFGVYIYSLVVLTNYRSRRQRVDVTPVAAMSLVFLGSFIIGAVDMGSAIADRIGVSKHVIASLSTGASLGLVAIIATFVVVYLVYLLARPSWLLLQEGRTAPQRLAELQQEVAELRRVRADVRDLSTGVDDKMILMLDYADPDIVHAAEEACTVEGVSDEDREVVMAAAREVTLRPDHIIRLRKVGTQSLPPDALDLDDYSSGARHFAKLSERDVYFYSDVHIVATLALGAERLGVPLRRQPQEWHRRLGRILAGVLEAYEQPSGYVAAYKRELERRVADKQHLLADLGLDALDQNDNSHPSQPNGMHAHT